MLGSTVFTKLIRISNFKVIIEFHIIHKQIGSAVQDRLFSRAAREKVKKETQGRNQNGCYCNNCC